MTEKRKYTDAEVRAIIDRAVNATSGGDVTHDELVSIASEVGISSDAVDRAAREIERARVENDARARVLRRRRRGFMSHASTYLLVNAFLFAINFLSTPGEWWVLFPALGWGLGLLFHARGAFFGEVSEAALRREQKRSPELPASPIAERASSARVRLESGGAAERASELEETTDLEHATDPAPLRRERGK